MGKTGIQYYVYLLRCEGGELYAGITTDLERRFAEHASGGPKAAKYTRTHPPVRIEASWKMPDKASASALEFRLKRLSHARKEVLVADPSAAGILLVESLARAKAPRVLMLGNSLTTSCGLPDLLAEAIGGEVSVHARGGARLSEHLNPRTRLGSMTQEALSSGGGGWTHVVLQERSDGPVRYRAAYLRAVSALGRQIRTVGAMPVIYATWAYASGCPKLQGLGMDHVGMHAALQSAFAEAVSANPAAEANLAAKDNPANGMANVPAEMAGGTAAAIANVGAAFFEAAESDGLYASDGIHPSPAGAALAAGVLASAILR